MALPKEPRQKMINMMYLVLTALLALNVSSEILNAFKTVNNTINNANNVLAANNSNIYTSFEEKAKDQKTAEKAAIWKPKADKAKELSSQLFSYIEGLKERVKKEGGYDLAKGDTTDWTDNLDATTRVLDKGGEGEKLFAKLKQYKADMLAIDPDIKREFETKLPIDLSTPKSSTGSQNQSWTTSYFHMTPAIAGITILSKFQNDIKSSENQVVTYCHNKIGEVAVRFDKYGFVGGLSSSYVMPGEKVEVYAGLGATSSAASPTILINGRPASVSADGIAMSEFSAGGTGSSKVHVTIKYKDQDGLDKTIEKDLPYTVGAPSGVAVSADKMNVLYIGVENPLTITAGVGSEKVTATFTGGSISRVGGPKWVAKPTTQGEHKINISIEGKVTPVVFRVKKFPDPYAYVGPSRGGSMPAAQFKAMGGVIARLDNSDFEFPFSVLSYTVGTIKNGVYASQPNSGNRWSGAAADLISAAGPGTAVFFDNIKVRGLDGIVRDLPQMSFNLK